MRLESDICDKIQELFVDASIKAEREVWVGKNCRVDFLTEDGVAIEIKKGKPNSTSVEKQIDRYSKSEIVNAIILVSERGLVRHLDESNGKHVGYVSLSSCWGVAV